VKIVDFGIAKAESQLETTRAGTLKGKFGYMSPEQAEGQPVDLRTDIFSLGIVLWELLANDRLFVANNEINTLRKIRDCQIPSLRKINPNLHSEVERIVQKALARDRNLRYQTGAALHRDLNRFLNRQYPDFSPQDFAVFIKSVFADEILSLRKRLVEYTKLNVGNANNAFDARPASGEFDDRTSLLDTNTNSLVISDSQVGQSPSSGILKNITSLSQITEPSASIENISKVSENTHTDAGHRPKGTSPSGVLNDAALAAEATVPREASVKPKVTPLHNGQQAPPPPSPDKQAKAPILNLETEDTGEPSIRRRASQRNSGRIEYASSSQSQSPARFATMMVFVIFCASFYTYLCKFFPDVMSPYIQKTEPYLSAYYDYVLPNRNNKNPVNVAGGGFETPIVRDPAQTNPVGNANANAVMVTSNPSGAEIWLNSTNTGKTTPQMIEVPTKDQFSITLRKRGYDDYRREKVTREAMGRKMDAILEKLSVGYLDVEIFPPQQAILYINGKQVAMQKAYARDVLVPANRAIKVRAESPNGDCSEEVQVQVPVDQKRSIRLNPRKNARVPSGTPN
jgi:serine/threonine protein kinase